MNERTRSIMNEIQFKDDSEILDFFEYEHLPENLQKISKPFKILTSVIIEYPLGRKETWRFESF